MAVWTLDVRGLGQSEGRPAGGFGHRPVVTPAWPGDVEATYSGAAAVGDSEARGGVGTLARASHNPASRLCLYAGAEHGVPLFASQPDLLPTVVEWVMSQRLARPVRRD